VKEVRDAGLNVTAHSIASCTTCVLTLRYEFVTLELKTPDLISKETHAKF
jgi:hypothetical protein